MKAYKGFNKDMTCRGFQFEEGKIYEEQEADLCCKGFHACVMPLDCLNYYRLNDSVYREVDLDEVDPKRENNSKVCGKKIRIGAQLSIGDIVKASVEYVKTEARPTTGNGAHSATTGNGAHSATTGNGAHSATTGNGAHSATTGDWAHSATTGNGAHSEVKGKNTIAAALGIESQARGAIGCWIVLAEYEETENVYVLRTVKCALVDGVNIKPDTWYQLKNGEFVEVENE